MDENLRALIDQANNLTDLSDEEIAGLREALTEAANGLLDNENPTDDDLGALDAIAEAVQGITAEQTGREAAAQERREKVEAAKAKIFGETPDPQNPDEGDPAPAGDEPAPTPTEVNVREAVPASAKGPVVTKVAARRPEVVAPRRPHPLSEAAPIVAAAGHPTLPAGTSLADPMVLAQAFIESARALGGTRGISKVPVARLGRPASESYGDEFTLTLGDPVSNTAKLERVVGRQAIVAAGGYEAIVAAGGICAPTEIRYDMPVVGSDERPVRDDMLVRVGASRGGIRTFPVPSFTDADGAVDVWTEANDQNPVDPETKPCLTLTCPTQDETIVDAITRCLRVGNFRDRFFPEQVAQWIDFAAIVHARFAEVRLLDTIGTGSTQITAGDDGGLDAVTDVLTTLDRAAAAMRSRHRLSRLFPLRWAIPSWALDMMRAGLARRADGTLDEKYAVADATLVSWFSARGVMVTTFLDGETAAGTGLADADDQIFGAQGDGALLGWPDQIVSYLYPEGSWLFLDGGTLDLGVMRDTATTETNDFQIFYESFEAAHFHGVESYRIVFDVCPNGRTAGPNTSYNPCTIGS